MRAGGEVSSPDGDRWLVRRRWTDRATIDLRAAWRKSRDAAAEFWGLSEPAFLDVGGGIVSTVATAVLVAFVVLVLLPLLGVALELVALLALAGAGAAARFVLGRPWVVEASNLDRPERSTAYAFEGWGRSGRAVREIAAAISASGPPGFVEAGERHDRR